MRTVRAIDIAIAVVALLVLIVAGVLGYSIWQRDRQVEAAAPSTRAINEIASRVRKDPNDIGLRMDLAQAFAVAGRNKEASEQYQAVLKIKKNYIPALSGLGFIASRGREWPKAEEYWRRSISLLRKQSQGTESKQYEIATYYLGTALLEQRKYEDAVGYFKESLRLNRSAADTHFLLAAAYEGLGANEEYKAELEFTLAFDPLMPEANYRYGLVMLEEGDVAAAAQHFRVAVDQAPEREEPQVELDKLGPASERLEKARRLSGSDPKKALVEARVAVAVDPDDIEALVLLGRLFEQVRDKEGAADAYRAAVAKDPANEEASAGLKRVSDGK